MNLDDPDRINSLDKQNMLAQLQDLPDQLAAAYQLGLQLALPVSHPVQAVVMAGMGGSAIGADLLAAYAQPLCGCPLVIHRNYGLPAWANNRHTLVIASSHSGNTEETLSVLQSALVQGCSALAISTGGELMEAAHQNKIPHWQFHHQGQPRSAVGFSFGLLAAALVRLGLMPDSRSEIEETVDLMRRSQVGLQPHLAVAKNRAKRDAGQLIGRWLVVLGADHLAPVALRWKNQVNELAKAWAQAEILPEADHNSLAALLNPEDALMHTMALFLTAPGMHPRNQVRIELTRQAFMQQGIGTDLFIAGGRSRLEQMWNALQYGDYLAYYLAIAYGVDPTPVDSLENFKAVLKQA